MIAPLPDTLEICTRPLDGHPCRGVIFRRGVDGTLPYCQKCSSQEPGVVYVKLEPRSGRNAQRRATTSK